MRQKSKPTKHQRSDTVLLIALLAVAAILRILASLNDLWFDEIMSLRLVGQMDHWYQVFTGALYDNNHYLNSLWLFFLGEYQDPFSYRLLSILAGVASVAAAYWCLAPWGRPAQWIAAVVLAFSFVQINYSSEARGYSLQLLFSLLAFGCLDRFHRRSQFRFAWLFGLFTSLGILSHLYTLNFILAAGAWSVTRRDFAAQRKSQLGSLPKRARELFACFLLPFVCGGCVYLVHIRHMDLGGGPEFEMRDVLLESWSLIVGVARPGLATVVAGALAMMLTAVGVVSCYREETRSQDPSQAWRFFFALLIVITLARAIVGVPPFVFVRYFLLQITFGALLLAILAANLWQQGGSRARLVMAGGVLMLASNLIHTNQLFACGRGSYQAALTAISERTHRSPISISSTHEGMNRRLIEYHQHFLDGKRFVYVDPTRSPEWYIVHLVADRRTALRNDEATLELHGQVYELQFTEATSFLSGCEWRCYQRCDTISVSVSETH